MQYKTTCAACNFHMKKKQQEPCRIMQRGREGSGQGEGGMSKRTGRGRRTE